MKVDPVRLFVAGAYCYRLLAGDTPEQAIAAVARTREKMHGFRGRAESMMRDAVGCTRDYLTCMCPICEGDRNGDFD